MHQPTQKSKSKEEFYFKQNMTNISNHNQSHAMKNINQSNKTERNMDLCGKLKSGKTHRRWMPRTNLLKYFSVYRV